jgi:tetraacyldisaccharide 4'-kinase
MLQFLKFLLFPFSLLYKGITSLRNLLFEMKFLPTLKIPVSSIGVGNLTVGGTGKTPIVDYLIKLLSSKKIAIISRGYGRKTKGFLEITDKKTVEEVGDEPFMLRKNNPEANFFVSENRVEGYQKASELRQDIEVFLFDDVFQHRYIKPKINILLCDYNRPFYDDFVLPTGLLRESRKGAKRADIVIVTKCPEHINEENQEYIKTKIHRYCKDQTPIFFTSFISLLPENSIGNILEKKQKIVLISGLANNGGFKNGLEKDFEILEHFAFKDHHDFKKPEIDTITNKFPDSFFVCSAKDFVKIERLIGVENKNKFYISRQKVEFFEEYSFKKLILERLSFT